MAILKTYPLKNNYYGPDRLILSDMQPDDQGVVHGTTKSLTLSSLKSFIGTGSDAFTLTTTGTSGAATFNTNTKILNIPDYSVGNVDGSGTASYMAKWTDSNTIGIGAIYDNAGNIGIGTTSPNYKLDVDGDLSAKGITSSTTHTVTIVATAGWYRIMQWSGASRGGATVKLSTTGGSVAPTTYVINAYKTYGDPASTNTLKLEQYGNMTFITKARIATDSVTSVTYVEIYNTYTTANYTMEVYHDSLLGLDSLTSVLTGTLQTGPNSVSQDELPFQIEGTTTEKLSSELVTLIGDGTNDGKLRFNCSANSHYVEVVGPTHSGGSSYSLKLPNSLPSVSNQILEANALGVLSWIPTPTGGGGGGGTVTSVGLTMPSAFSVGNSPITGSGNISVGVTGGSAGQYLDYQGNWSTPTQGLTSVGLSAPPAFSVTGSPLTSNGSISIGVTGGSSGEFLAYNGQWATPTDTNSTYSLGTGATPGQIILTGSNPTTSQTVTVAGTNGISITQFTGGTFNVNLNLATSSTRGGVKIGFAESGKNYPVELSSEKMFVNVPWTDTVYTLPEATATARGGIELFSNTTQTTEANSVTTTANRTYGIQLNNANQAVVNVPWVSGSGGGISFSGTRNSAGSIDYDGTDNVRRLKIGDLSTGNSGIVEVFTDGTRQFQFGVNGEIGLGENASQGTSGQVLTSQGNGSAAIWSSSGGQNIANTNLTQTATRTYAMAQYALTFTGTSSISMQQSNGLVVNGNIISNSQSYAAKNSISNKNTSFTVKAVMEHTLLTVCFGLMLLLQQMFQQELELLICTNL